MRRGEANRTAERDSRREDVVRQPETPREPFAGPLFADDIRRRHQQRWESIQTSFVDDPRRSMQEAEALAADVTKQIQDSFAQHRQRLESAWGRGAEASTEDLRRALRQYRSYFTRLLSM